MYYGECQGALCDRADLYSRTVQAMVQATAKISSANDIDSPTLKLYYLFIGHRSCF